jgi:hypothetical protein
MFLNAIRIKKNLANKFEVDKKIENIINKSASYLGYQIDVKPFENLNGFRVIFDKGHLDFLIASQVIEVYLKQERK